MKKISFIMPAKNAEVHILDAIEALQSVSNYDWELIVVEDAPAPAKKKGRAKWLILLLLVASGGYAVSQYGLPV